MADRSIGSDDPELSIEPRVFRQNTHGLWTPTGSDSSDRLTLINELSAHSTLVLTLATGIAYLLGVQRVNSFADSLNVAPSDLGVEFRDYLVLAGYFALPAILSALTFAVVSKQGAPTLRRRAPRNVFFLVRLVVVLGIAAYLYAAWYRQVPFEPEFTDFMLGLLGLVVFLALTAESAMHSLNRRSKRRSFMIWFIAVAVLVNSLQVYSYIRVQPQQWATQLEAASTRLWLFTNPDLQVSVFGLNAILRPAVATIEVDGQELCVIRVGGDTYLYEGRALVVPGGTTAKLGCEPTPFERGEPLFGIARAS